MSAGTMPYIGSKISLVSNADIRYEGVLYTINTQESTIALQSVRCFGTEGRKVPEIPPSSEVYDFIIFRGQDIKDLTVLESRGQVADPAIVSINQRPAGAAAQAAAKGAAPPTWKGAAKGDYAAPLGPVGKGQGKNPWGTTTGISAPPPLRAPAPEREKGGYGGGYGGGDRYGAAAGAPAWGNRDAAWGGGSNYNQTGTYGGGGYGTGTYRDRDVSYGAGGNYGGGKGSYGGDRGDRGGYGYGGKSGWGGETRTYGEAPKGGKDAGKGKAVGKGEKGKGKEPEAKGKGYKGYAADAGKGKGGKGEKGKGKETAKGKAGEKGGKKGKGKETEGKGKSGGGKGKGERASARQMDLVGELRPEENPEVKKELAEDFDVQEANEKFDKVADLSVVEEKLKPLAGYDKAKSFFDEISCEATERTGGVERQKVDRERAREFDKETFGDMRRPTRLTGGKGRRRASGKGGFS